MRILVTGGTGFIGNHLVRALCGEEYTVRCLIRGDLPKRRELELAGAVECVTGDLESPDGLVAACSGCEVILHLAAALHETRAGRFIETNLLGTRNLIQAAKGTGEVPHLIQLSSLAAAVFSENSGAPSEAGPGARSDYGSSKYLADREVRKSGLEWTILRPPAVYGPGDRQLLPLFRMARGRWIPVAGLGMQRLSLLFVGDLVQCLLSSLRRRPSRKILYPCHEEVWLQRELAEMAFRAVNPGASRRGRVVLVPHWICSGAYRFLGALPWIAGFPSAYSSTRRKHLLADGWVCPADDSRKILGWVAETGLREGLEETAKSYRQMGWI